MCMTHEIFNSIVSFWYQYLRIFKRTHRKLTQCMIHNKLFSIVTRREEILKYRAYDVDLWYGSNCSKSNERWRSLSYFILSWVTFDVRNVVLYQGLDNHTKFGGSWLNSHEITAFYGIQLGGYSCHLYCNNALLWHRCVSNHGHNIPTKFGDIWSNGKEIEALLRKSRWRRLPCWILVTSAFRLHILVCIKVAIPQLNLALTSQIVKKWQTFSEIQDGGVRHF